MEATYALAKSNDKNNHSRGISRSLSWSRGEKKSDLCDSRRLFVACGGHYALLCPAILARDDQLSWAGTALAGRGVAWRCVAYPVHHANNPQSMSRATHC